MQREIRNKLLKNFTDEELLAEIIFRSEIKKGLPIKAKCFQCKKEFWIKWNNTTQSHSKIAEWKYWSGEQATKKVCNLCLRAFCSEKSVYLQVIKDQKKLNHLTSRFSWFHKKD